MGNCRQLLGIKGQCVLLISVLIAMSLLIGGCSKDEQQEKNSYRDDGYMGYSNSNPNLFNRNSTQSYQEDIRYVKEVLAPVEGIRNVKTGFNGSELHVLIQADEGLSRTQLASLRMKVRRVVQQNLPDYVVHVDVES